MPPNPTTAIEQSEEGRAFLQRRLANMGMVGAGISFAFVLFRLAFSAVEGRVESYILHPSMLFHVGAALCLFGLWVLCRRGRRSLRVMRGAEYASLWGASIGYAGMGYYIPLHNNPHMIVLMAAAFALIARAVYVPSTAKRTVGIGIDVATPPLVVGYLHYLQVDISKWGVFDPAYLELTPHEYAIAGTAWGVAWWSATIVVCAAASKVIYGLRKEARDARKLGQYTLEEKLGEGGMGVVYRASHAMLRRPTAVKLVPPEKAGERALARFEREVQLTAILTHPNTVTVFDYGRTPEGVFYYAMEYLEGATLGELVETTGPMSPSRVVHVLEQAAGALAEAHRIGLIHRDVKPANVMLVERGGLPDVVKVLDFGLVKEINQDSSVSVTKAEVITGTPQYMSPEAIRDATTVDERSDLYALGAVGYFILTGRHVFTGQSVVEVCSEHLHGTPVPPSERLGAPLPEGLEQVILDCLSKEKADRPQSATVLRDLLRALPIPAWTEEQARDWWLGHARALRRDRDQGRTDGAAIATDVTLDVDLAHRQTAAS